MKGSLRMLGVAVLFAATAACTNPSSMTIAPTPISAASVQTPIPPSAPAPSPAPIEVTLTGRVSESVPTAPTGIPGATVTIGDGANAGKSAVSDFFGFYTIRNFEPSSATLIVSADGFVGTSRHLGVMGNTTSNFELTPVPQVLTHTLTGEIAAGDGTCSDGLSNRPCRIVMIPIHNPGPIDATLTWTAGTAVNLDLTLFQTNDTSAITRSNNSGADPEKISANLTAAATYELRITYTGGTDEAKYKLKVTHLN